MLANNGENVIGADDLVFFVVNFDFGTAVTAGQNDIADFDIERNFFAAVIGLTSAESNNFEFLGFFFGGIGDDDPPLICSATSQSSNSTRSPSGLTLTLAISDCPFLCLFEV